jgi:hypothetical protein
MSLPRPTRLRRHAARWAVAAACFLAAGVPFAFFLDNGRGGWNLLPGAFVTLCPLCAFVSALAAFDAWSRSEIQPPGDRTPRGFDVLPPSKR